MPSTDNEHSLNNQSQGHDITANNSNVNTNTNAHHKSSHNTLANEPVALTEEDRQKEDATGTNPDFSLAGPYNNPQNVYISPEYLENNPGYGKPHDEPLWSLAQPFPRVVRPGMRMRGEKGEEVGTPEEAQQTATSPEKADGELGKEGKEEDPAQKVSKPRHGDFFNTWGRIRNIFREFLGELLGSTIALLIGLCASLSRVTSQEQAGTFESQSWAWGFGFMVGIYVAGGISGGHLNPAISISLSVFRGFPVRMCLQYMLAQILAALASGGIAYGIYYNSIHYVASINQQTPSQIMDSVFYTMPKEWVHPAAAFFNEFVGTGILVCTILALGDHTNAPPGAGMQAFLVGLLIMILCVALGYNTGGCFNPARDFGPRLFALMAGYGGRLFTQKHAWWVWGSWVADIAGGLFGAFIYDSFIFTGGESPVNYTPRRRKRAYLIKKMKFRNRLGRKRHQNADIESAIRNVENE
ncbi:MIP/aquaporin family protein [Aspergillus ruber CBS 135680]|uniref:Aquaporin-like protein n=1 Tax=Aspergillus ruber (strain CBS 135680) TaxID=1388766 RepID=A0A017S040_ASPRC|nr:aquaporin-like protein [Aspergillus ruber CBS 135680]EYE90403.1 aquaporin-like protein [Aspergillus ruber CBS 135680]